MLVGFSVFLCELMLNVKVSLSYRTFTQQVNNSFSDVIFLPFILYTNPRSRDTTSMSPLPVLNVITYSSRVTVPTLYVHYLAQK